MRMLLPKVSCPDESAACCSGGSGGTVVPPGFDLVGHNFAFQYDEDLGQWVLYIVEFETYDADSVYGSKLWATTVGPAAVLYADAKELLSSALPSDVSIATLGINYRFINGYLQIQNYDSPGTWHKIWSTTVGPASVLYVDAGET